MVWRGLAVATISVGLSTALASAARATEFELTLTGVFNGTADALGNSVITETLNAGPGGANVLTADEPFTLTGIFDTSTGTLLPPPSTGFPSTGFVDYAARSVTLSVGGATYNVSTSVTQGLTVAIFDKTQIFGPDHYGAGFIQDPVSDGAGIVGDWLSATPDYTVTSLAPTTYSDYFGVGFGSGICSFPGSGVDCATTPIPLDGGLYELTLGTYDLNNPTNGIPTDPTIHPPAFQDDNLFSGALTAVPESSTWVLLLVGFAGLGIAGVRGVRTGRTAA
jgi:hypothetical protein